MENLDKLLRERGLRNDFIIAELNIPDSTYYRKKKEGTFSYYEAKKIFEIMKKIKPLTFESLG